MANKINTCRSCNIPIVWTFAFPGAEYFCLKCHGNTGMMGGVLSVKSTPELRAHKRVIEALWKTIYKFYLPQCNYGKGNCKKCKEKSLSHREHLTKQEVLCDEYISKVLQALKGKL